MTEYISFGDFDEMVQAIQAGKEMARDAMSAKQRALCDGEQHYAVCMESEKDQIIICVSRIMSRLEFEARQFMYVSEDSEESLGEAVYAIDTYYGDGGCVSFGYLPCETWDTVYQIDEPDLHDRHASTLWEITKEEFDALRAIRQDPIKARDSHVTLTPLIYWFNAVKMREYK